MTQRRCSVTAVLAAVSAACGGGATTADAPRADGATPAADASTITDAVTASCDPVRGSTLALELVATADDAVVLVTSPPGDRRAFAVERDGAIQILVDGQLVATPFLDISDGSGGPVLADGERGLLGLAFHPAYAANGRFFVFYTTVDDAGFAYDELAEYRVDPADDQRALASSAKVLLSIPDYANNHNGGMLAFGTDGYLYISVGDGGGPGDPERTAQDRHRLLGKMLRIDVDTAGDGRPYGIPPENPYADGVDGAPEVLMYGLRNPWRWSFDAATGELYIADVGYRCSEEVDVIAPDRAANADLGWSDCEGSLPRYGTSCAAPREANRVVPVYEQLRTDTRFDCAGPSVWRAIIGGQVYRGTCYPDLVGRYIFADYGGEGVHSFVYAGGVATDYVAHPGTGVNRITSIHGDALGELYLGTVDGDIYRVVAR
jgi:glucose/arabinose dehydrogenase